MPGMDTRTAALAAGGLASVLLLTLATYVYRRRQKGKGI
jgi:LPXTG-motif cell wall-anchored protein